MVKGPLNFLPRYDALGEILYACLGKLATSQPDAPGHPNTYDHDFTHEDDPTVTLPSYGFDLGVEKLKERRISGAWVDKLTFSVKGASELAVRADVIGADEAGATFASFTPAYSSLDPISGSEIVTHTLGATAIVAEETQIVINNASPAQHAHKARTLPKVEYGPLEVTGVQNLKFDSVVHLDDFLAETERDLLLLFRGAIIEGTLNFELEFDINRISYDTGDAFIDRQERKIQNLQFTALKPATGDFIKLRLRNNVVSY